MKGVDIFLEHDLLENSTEGCDCNILKSLNVQYHNLFSRKGL